MQVGFGGHNVDMTTYPVLLPLLGVDYVGGRVLLGYFPSADAAAEYCSGREWSEAWSAVLVRDDGVELSYDEDGTWVVI